MSLTEEWLKTKVNNWFNMRYLLKPTIEDSIENILNKSMVELNVMLLDRIWSSNEYKNIIFLHPIVKEAIDACYHH